MIPKAGYFIDASNEKWNMLSIFVMHASERSGTRNKTFTQSTGRVISYQATTEHRRLKSQPAGEGWGESLYCLSKDGVVKVYIFPSFSMPIL